MYMISYVCLVFNFLAVVIKAVYIPPVKSLFLTTISFLMT